MFMIPSLYNSYQFIPLANILRIKIYTTIKLEGIFVYIRGMNVLDIWVV